MYYYLVWVRSSRYHGSDPLTYGSEQKLSTGSIVEVELQREKVIGVVSGTTTKPRFQIKPISKVYDLPQLPTHLLKLAQWLKEYYPAPLGIVSQQLLPASFSDKQMVEPDAEAIPEQSQAIQKALALLPPLSEEQSKALEAMTERDTYLLHGTTGSGKTRVYIELAARAFAAGKSAIILTPEISLTTQLAMSFEAVFANQVVVMHSNQAPGERRQAWLKCLRAEQPVIVIGPRSALFSPLNKLGIIIIDESHEAAYKQEQSPQYQTGRVASYLANLTRASLVLGSATPSISDYFLAEQKNKSIVTMTKLARQTELLKPKITVVDRREKNMFSRSPFFSNPLLTAVETALSRGEQSLLYLNRRGTARMVLCEQCGWQADCPHCDVPLTYHGDNHSLRCHSCDYRQPAPASCPNCGHASVIYKTAGTKAIADEIQRLFPSARVARFDADNNKAERFEKHYEAVARGDVDILVGTQLLAKGLDLPKLSTLGIILADTSLYMPDFSAQERTFQLITQVLGRIGRGHVAGTAIIQTYHPDHEVLRTAINNDYSSFYKSELASRQQFLFPPFCYLLKLGVRRASNKSAEDAATALRTQIEGSYKVRVEGPAPSFYEKLRGKYQWQLVVKATERSELLRVIADLPSGWSYDIDPLDLL